MSTPSTSTPYPRALAAHGRTGRSDDTGHGDETDLPETTDRPWRLDEETRRRGRAGVALARAQLRAALERRARGDDVPRLDLVA